MPNLLFVCSKNQWRSPTAKDLFKNHARHQARSAGTSDKARIKINQKLIEWADVIFVMERRHKELIKQRFPAVIKAKPLLVLDIEDNYQYGDTELIEILKDCLSEYL
ncbi:low molecular weight protein tyrosine phosphatase family protein [Mucilaginibacter sp.]|uniref:low molecular weight protein tyrosine phosphatase family protein n=1 Tax=Mucilaginibacter sp. TaxID=1882438 RepID=UPI003D0A9389